MSWRKSHTFGESSGAQKAVLALGACAVAGMAAVRLKRVLASWRNDNLRFDFPIEEQLFIGWGGSSPRYVKRPR